MRFHKYQALGNDYLVLDLAETPELAKELICRVCDRHYGIGSDGILAGREIGQREFRLRILNPDGSEAEKSGNGLRIFARYLWDEHKVDAQPFVVHTLGGDVSCEVRDGGAGIFVEMGQATFASAEIPVRGPVREVVGEQIAAGGGVYCITAVSVGNPHCVVTGLHPSPELAREVGPLLEVHPWFPNRTNVQFMEVLDHHRIRLEIWERGAGYTLASGSSSCAAAAASVRLGHCASPVTVVMPGGTLEIEVRAGYALTMLGPAQKIATCDLAT